MGVDKLVALAGIDGFVVNNTRYRLGVFCIDEGRVSVGLGGCHNEDIRHKALECKVGKSEKATSEYV